MISDQCGLTLADRVLRRGAAAPGSARTGRRRGCLLRRCRRRSCSARGLTVLIFGQLGVVGLQGELGGRERFAQCRRVERRQRLASRDLGSWHRGHAGHMSRYLETGGSIVDGLDRSHDHEIAGNRGAHGRSHAKSAVARAARGQCCGPTGHKENDDDRRPDDQGPPSRSASLPLGSVRHWMCHSFHRHRHRHRTFRRIRHRQIRWCTSSRRSP